MTSKAADTAKSPSLLVLGALGVVYGDLGTSPLYAMKAVVTALGGTLSAAAALGSLSLIIWTLIVTVSVKYCIFVMRADNHGEGGILALMSLTGANRIRGRRWFLTVIGLFGAALIYGDGMITPAISVLSALEGINVATQAFAHYVLPVAISILIALFAIQRYGTARIGLGFGPIMLIWFGVIAVLGLVNIIRHPAALAAINPIYIVRFFHAEPLHAFLAMGGVFLCVTGGEALYADIGHFGARPIRIAWYGLVLPALLLNYIGQVGNLLAAPASAANPFFRMGPDWAIYPLVVLATLATIIASQAIITGVFSLTRQAVQLGWLAGMTIHQTSKELYGQIYVPAANWLMMVATVGLALSFQSSSRLAGAYGMAVSTTMLLTTLLLIAAMRRIWNWRRPAALMVGGCFAVVDLAYFAANLVKLPQGGWIPLLVALVVFGVMVNWRTGVDTLHRHLGGCSYEKFLGQLRGHHLPRVPGVAVFLTRAHRSVPALLQQHVEHMGALRETVIALSVSFVTRPRVNPHDRARAKYLGAGLWRVTVRFGYLEQPDLMAALEGIAALRHLVLRKMIFFGARDLVAHDDGRSHMTRWQVRLFGFMLRNSAKTMDRFRIPPENFVEIAREVKM